MEKELVEGLCNNYNCLHNEPVFNGFDADILIPSLKLAITWDGVWHYKQLPLKTHNLKRTQRNDKQRIIEIKNKGWNYIVVKDFEPFFSPIEAYHIILDFIEEDIFDVTVFGIKTE